MIAQEFSTPHTPQQNGKVERSNRVVVEMARTMLKAAGMRKRFWSDAVLAAVYIQNRCPTKVLGGKTPTEVVTGRTPVLHKLRVFGCDSEVLLPKSQRHKLDAKTVKAIFIGYEKSGGYRFWVPSGRGGSGSVIISMTAVFFEASVPRSRTVTLDGEMPTQAKPASEVVPNQLDTIQEDTEMEDTDSNQPSNDKSARRLDFKESHNTEETALISELNDPLTLQEAMSRPDAEQWRQAINRELNSVRRNGTYEEVFAPAYVRPVQTKWVFRRKTLADGSLDKYKARLVAKGVTQQYGVDYTETFSPVVRHDSIRAILALVVQLYWGHLQLNVQTAFLNSDLDEVIFITPPTETGDDKWGLAPPHFIQSDDDDSAHANRVQFVPTYAISVRCLPTYVNGGPITIWKLRKALYGLKQASRAWYETVTKFLCQAGFAQCQSDSCVLVKRTANSIVAVLLYVDDMLIFSEVASELAAFQANITSRFAINKCDASSSFVGMELTWSKAGDMLTIGQQKYTATVVKRFASSDDRSRSRTPMDSNFQHLVADDMQTISESIRPAVGSLLYASTVSPPDLTTAVRLIAQEAEQPTRTVQAVIGRVFGYLARTADMGMVYRRSTKRELQLEVYCDAAFVCERERKSSTGFVAFLNGCCISWGSKKQQIVTLSTTESEYVALAH
ncbi:unnamed protein product [Phytophthora fragariaefolia]|uniref:Unnamed protein product n=1 Tax=Phytophthora fragariaefolia TaxID=1490495 RepID=A0A9W6XHQ2_9STRA|nr:unnamed protein product [Phytophthora fragariaefolia]